MQTLSLCITGPDGPPERKQISQQLTRKTQRELESFQHYEAGGAAGAWCLRHFLSRHPLSACCLPALRRLVCGPTVLPAQRTWPRLWLVWVPRWAQGCPGPSIPTVQRSSGCPDPQTHKNALAWGLALGGCLMMSLLA